ncbi:hypothetical protein GEMRC1_010981 [Eukaryota sp. GEM-RC1]
MSDVHSVIAQADKLLDSLRTSSFRHRRVSTTKSQSMSFLSLLESIQSCTSYLSDLQNSLIPIESPEHCPIPFPISIPDEVTLDSAVNRFLPLTITDQADLKQLFTHLLSLFRTAGLVKYSVQSKFQSLKHSQTQLVETNQSLTQEISELKSSLKQISRDKELLERKHQRVRSEIKDEVSQLRHLYDSHISNLETKVEQLNHVNEDLKRESMEVNKEKERLNDDYVSLSLQFKHAEQERARLADELNLMRFHHSRVVEEDYEDDPLAREFLRQKLDDICGDP